VDGTLFCGVDETAGTEDGQAVTPEGHSRLHPSFGVEAVCSGKVVTSVQQEGTLLAFVTFLEEKKGIGIHSTCHHDKNHH